MARSFFLVVFDPQGEELLRVDEFPDPADAATARRRTEEEFQGSRMQVVLFSARSLDKVKRTHPHYFRGPSSGDTLEFAALAH